MRRMLAVCMIGLWVVGCGGGGGGGGDSSNGMSTEQERAQAFLDEAIRVGNENAVVMCDLIVCSITDDDNDFVHSDGVVSHGCQWNCLESRIDDSGETRNYLIYLVWRRFPDGCFEPSEVFLQQEIRGLCVPNQERF